ncbi:MAG: UvrB/UvrC motif-containing protein [Halioglobus sp.]|nr:UvrB/UvrC motif-containing protein [Halioglobus sp.]
MCSVSTLKTGWKSPYNGRSPNLTPAALSRQLKESEAQMHEHAKNPEFEQAATLRDQLAEIKQQEFVT